MKPAMLRLDDNHFTVKQLLLTTFHHGVTLVLTAVLPTHPFFKEATQQVQCRCVRGQPHSHHARGIRCVQWSRFRVRSLVGELCEKSSA